jgi:hypothetical protein
MTRTDMSAAKPPAKGVPTSDSQTKLDAESGAARGWRS